ncbi:MAG: adenylate/guanylate cyclase domain-containing protein [Rhizobiaceae bacterium]|nr:adenylate/guanylate cyclase domain-containing protein [Rhizobiaceae bacterium]
MIRAFRNKTFVVLILCLLALVLACQLRISDFPIMASLRDITFDTYQQFKPRATTEFPIRIVDIDEASIAKLGQWPWPRTKLAELTDKLREAGSAVLAFDMVFAEPDRTSPKIIIEQMKLDEFPELASLKSRLDRLPDNDVIFGQAIAKQQTVLALFPTNGVSVNEVDQKSGYAFLGDDPKDILPQHRTFIANLEVIQRSAAGLGTASVDAENRDDIIRRIPLFFANGDKKFPNLGLETLRIALQAKSFLLKTNSASDEIQAGELALTYVKVGNYAVPVTSNGQLQLYYTRPVPSRYVPAHEVLTKSSEELSALFDGHIVFVGTSAAGLKDLRTTALGETVPGVSIHAQIVDQILAESYLRRPDWATGAEIITMIGVTALIVSILPFVGALTSALIGLLFGALIAATSWFAFAWYGLLLDPIFPLLTCAGIYMLATALLFAFTEKEKRFVRSAFQRYLAPDLLRKLEKSPEALKLGGEVRNLSIMFMDIRGFTPISEKLSPEELVTFLNKLLSPLSEIILEHEGAIDKYIGDSIMAFWNAPLDVDDHPKKATIAALKMLEAMDKLNAEDAFGFKSADLNLGDVKIGIGICTGEGCVGNMGSNVRFDYSVIGDTVNVASRIESSCKTVGWPLLVSGSTARGCDSLALLEAGSIPLKGKSKPELLFAVIGDANFRESEKFRHVEGLHQATLSAKNKTAFAKAKAVYTSETPERYDSFIDNLGQSDA